MTQDNNIQQDTPLASKDEPSFASLEEAVFGDKGSLEVDNTPSAFTDGTEGDTQTAPQGQPVPSTPEKAMTPPVLNNDETRYQYWQSQADKYKNELETMRQTQQQPQQVPQQAQAPAQSEEKPVEAFPAPPDKPQKPRVFNREEAYSDPASESARYLDELEGWRDDMNEYNSLKSQYQTAVIEDKFNNLEKTRVEDAKRQQAAQKKNAQEAEIRSHVMGHYGMGEDEAKDFMTKMSDPNSITIDNLVQLYRFQNSGAQQQQTPPTPSQTFTQTKNAQQVPSPMGVMPSGQSNADTTSFEDKIMDTMIGSFNSKNPWK